MSARRAEEEHENHERWLVSYADFITLLFAFFVVLYATSTQNMEKEKKFEESIRSEFNMGSSQQKGQGAGQGPGLGVTAGDMNPVEIFQRRNSGNQELEDAVKRIIDKKMSKEEQQKFIQNISHDNQGVRISLSASAFFGSGSSKLYYPALQALDKLADILQVSTHNIQIEGHTDDQPINGSTDGNWELASLRATSVVRYLAKYHHIAMDRLSAVSYASQKPVDTNATEEGRSKNRRVEILIMNKSNERDEE